MRFLKHHLFQYFLILMVFAITVTAVVAPIATGPKIFYIVIALGIYFFWAVWHHWEDHTLTLATVLEYLILTLILFWLLINLAY